LTVNGTGFATMATVRWNGSDRNTTWISPTQLQAVIGAADIATVGTANVAVNNPAPNGGVSGTYKFAIDSPTTAGFTANATSVILNVIHGQSTPLAVTFSGTVTAAQLSATCINLPPGGTCTYNSSTSTVTIATSSSTPRGSYQIGVIFTVAQLASVRRHGLYLAACGGLLGLPLGAVWIVAARGDKRRRWVMILLALLLVAMLAACGGSSSKPAPPSPVVVPVGTQSTAIVTLNVN
jgi:predicted small lipoprotein YifL